MKKTISKIISLFSLGLLLFAVSDAYASKGQIAPVDAWQFMKEHTADEGKAFREKFGDNISEVISRSKNKNTKTEEKNCFTAKTQATGQQTTTYCIEQIGTSLTVRAAEKVGGKSCEVVEVSWYESRKCIFCPLIGVLYAASENISNISYDNFAKSLAIVVAVGLMVWIAFKTLLLVSDLSKQDAAKYITEIMEQTFKFLIVFFTLLYYNQIFDLVINPIIRSGMAFGTSFVENVSLAERFGDTDEEKAAIYNAIKTGNQSALASVSDKLPPDYKRNIENNFFNLYTYATMENLAFNVNMEYSLLQTVGKSLICIGSKLIMGKFENESDGFGLGIACIIYGLCFGAFGFILSISFIFYLFDAVVELGIVGALLPLLIAAWPFKITTEYTSKGFQMLLNSVFIFMTMGLVTEICIELISAAVSFNITQAEPGESASNANSGLASLVVALTAIDTKSLGRMVNIISIGFLLFLVTNLVSMLLLQKVKEFAGQFSKGCVPDVGNKLGGTMASAAVGTAKKAITTPAKGFASGFGEAFSGVKNRFHKKSRIIKNRIAAGVVSAVGLDGVMAARAERKEAEGKASAEDVAKNKQNIGEILK